MSEFPEKFLNNSSFSSQKLKPTFAKLKVIINNEHNNFKNKKTAWRQQTFLLINFSENFSSVLVENLWVDYSHFVNNKDLETEFFNAYDENVEINSRLVFPKVNGDCLPDQNERKMFNDVSNSGHFKPFEVKEYKQLSPFKIRNTMENFLQRNSLIKDSGHSAFLSARQLLDMQGLKKNTQHSVGKLNDNNYLESGKQRNQKEDIGFNFGATKKSLGSLGRIFNSNRKNYVSPVRTKSFDGMDSEMTTLLAHPSLKNVDAKMVELISNEIIYKFAPVDWAEIAGLEYAKSIIKEAVVYPLLRPDIFTGLRRPPKGILLFGPPGTGKTLIGKCIASQSGSTFFSISASSLTSKWMGEGEKMVRALFAVAIARQPSVIFIDEVDSLLSQRSDNENEGTRRLKTEFLVRLDGAATSDEDRVLIVGATNRPKELDEAVRRRFVKRLYVPLPEEDARTEILKNLLKTVENNLNLIEIQEISRLAEGYSGSDMDSLCREASMEPLRSLPAEDILSFRKDHLRPVSIEDFYVALRKVRPSVSRNDLAHYVEWNKSYGTCSC